MCNYNCKYCNSSNNVIKKGIKYNKQCYITVKNIKDILQKEKIKE